MCNFSAAFFPWNNLISCPPDTPYGFGNAFAPLL